jgi:hypothetical protein
MIDLEAEIKICMGNQVLDKHINLSKNNKIVIKYQIIQLQLEATTTEIKKKLTHKLDIL